MYKTVVVAAPFLQIEGRSVETMADIDYLAGAISEASNRLFNEGYEVISIMPFTRGAKEWNPVSQVGMGWSFTDSAIITAKRIRDGASVPPTL